MNVVCESRYKTDDETCLFMAEKRLYFRRYLLQTYYELLTVLEKSVKNVNRLFSEDRLIGE